MRNLLPVFRGWSVGRRLPLDASPSTAPPSRARLVQFGFAATFKAKAATDSSPWQSRSETEDGASLRRLPPIYGIPTFGYDFDNDSRVTV